MKRVAPLTGARCLGFGSIRLDPEYVTVPRPRLDDRPFGR
jgi:hypothetical protein